MKLLNNNPLILFVLFSNNNIICTLTNISGNVLTWVTAGSNKSKGSKKITNITIFNLTKNLYSYSKQKNSLSIYIKIKGSNKLKISFIKYLKLIGFNVLLVQEQLLLSHGGCKKPRCRKL